MSEEVKNNEFTFENPAYRQTYWHTCSHDGPGREAPVSEVKQPIGPPSARLVLRPGRPFAFTPGAPGEDQAEMRKICKEAGN